VRRHLPHTDSPIEMRRAIQRLTDALDSEEAEEVYAAEANEAVAFGLPVYVVAGFKKVGLARSDTQAKSRVEGIALATALSGNSVTYLVSGRVFFTDWTTIIGAALLTPGAVYYLADTGGLTAVAPTAAGKIVTEVGLAVESTVLNLHIKRPVLL